MKMIVLFLMVFTAGPITFWVLAKQPPTKRYFVLLWLVAIVLVGVAFAFSRLGAPTAFTGLKAILALWFAWIVVLALCVSAVRLTVQSARVKRWAFIVGAMATTLPWFGLYAAQMMAQ